ncbi:hypothetical protein GCM10027515_04920 [Schumannella luteola]|uniref:Uncharacterized protein n=1 Tax=Schumannella luteola TaxID=472059 RepID=A0A852YAZ8_9MICO|nr:hypothetical protein [Schumannella luteola]NYG98371.1 hypothetical protein [Schumannella luteola]TPX05790.1 hypothetical protein FJ656_05040 [Schumannella luteola]
MTIAQTQEPATSGAHASATAETAPEQIDIPDHPSLGSAGRTVVTPLTATVYQVSRGDRILGFIEAAGVLWVALRGSSYGWAVEVGQFHALGPALRELAETIDEIPDDLGSRRAS